MQRIVLFKLIRSENLSIPTATLRHFDQNEITLISQEYQRDLSGD